MEELGMLVLFALVYPFVAAWLVGLGRVTRIKQLEQQVAVLNNKLQQPGTPLPATPAPRPLEVTVPEPAPYAHRPAKVRVAASHSIEKASTGEISGDDNAHPIKSDSPTTAPEEVRSPKPAPAPPQWLVTAKTWLMTGNLVAKLGLVILFIGIAFLLKYVAATITIPIEVRLAAVVLADLALLAWGWRLRIKRREIGLPAQGTAIAILMLVIFSASQRYDLIPTGFAFALLVSLTIFTCLLAVLQEAPWLAAFGITGGFACPILLSTGEGSHIALFSYYAMLNVGVFVLAVKRSWHQLNLLGFAFTFGVAGAWGGLRYTPDHYQSAQAFLILFFLCYSAIPVVFAGRKTTRLQDYVDVTLVMGTPLLTFGFQVALVRDMPFGLAFSALGLGGFYLVAGTMLWRAGKARWRMLVQTFTVLGAIFGTLTIPLALDARWTSAAWALEGFGFVWFGLRHRRRSIWVCGLLLQVAAWMSFIPALSSLDRDDALTAHLWLGFLLLAGSAYAIAVVLRKPGGDEQDLSPLADTVLGLAAAWLLAGFWTEAALRLSGAALANWLVIGAMLTGTLLYAISLRMAWPMARQLVLAAQIAGAIGLVVVSAPGLSWTSPVQADYDAPLLALLLLAVAACATGHTLRRARPADDAGQLASTMLVASGIWWVCAINVVASQALDYLPEALGSGHSRWLALYALGIVTTSIACVHYAPRLAWPQLCWFALVCWGALDIITLQLLARLYGEHVLPDAAVWIAWALVWAGSEQAMRSWRPGGVALNHSVLKFQHTVRTGGPWLALWPTGAILIDRWLATSSDSMLTGQDSWLWDAAWSNYLPTWLMMLSIVVLLRRSKLGQWPTGPLAHWYRLMVVPVLTLLLMLPVALWNLRHDGAMAPLPYLPLLNPLDLTTGFVLMLWVSVSRQLSGHVLLQSRLLQRLKVAGVFAAWLWFNLILLRSATHYLGIDYRFNALAASNAVQALLSLVWGATALVLMRMAARGASRRIWWCGALLLGIVVAKLFVIDLASGGSIARVVSFVGVGLLLLLVGYLAPYPKARQGASSTAPA